MTSDATPVALVTGASSGIGQATVRRLAARGYQVAALARRGDRLEALAREMAGTGATVVPITGDVTDDAQGRGAVTRTVEEFGGLDVLVNNAGVMLLGPFENSPPSDWRRMLELNVLALLQLTQEAIPHLRKAAAGPRGVADVINLGSVAGRVARANFAAYNASKFAVTGLSESLRQELAPDGIRVCCVEPGMVDSELLDHVDADVRDRLLSGALRAATPITSDDVANVIEFLVQLAPSVAVNELVVRSARQPF